MKDFLEKSSNRYTNVSSFSSLTGRVDDLSTGQARSGAILVNSHVHPEYWVPGVPKIGESLK